jgi:hypothetical protein
MVTQNHKLLNEAENLEYELGRANTQVLKDADPRLEIEKGREQYLKKGPFDIGKGHSVLVSSKKRKLLLHKRFPSKLS